MGTVMLVCIYLGYMGNEYAVLTLNENNKYLLINLSSIYGEKQPGDFFDTLPYGTVCKLKIKQEVGQYSAGAVPGGGSGTKQYTYFFMEGSVLEKTYPEITLAGEAFSVYNREAGKRIQIRLDKVLGKEIVAGWDQVSKADWFFLELDNYNELTDADYDQLYTKWKKNYDTGKKLFVSLILSAHREEYQNVWAPSGGTTVKHYWIIKQIKG